MIKVVFYESITGEVIGFRISGHAKYEKAGKDIVCAAVSSASYMAINTLTEILNIHANVSVDNGKMEVAINEKDTLLCRDILNGFRLHIKSLEKIYPKHLKVIFMGV